jgi:S1-C subfamily serine protease
MIITPDGEVLTNNHVVDGSTAIHVTIEGRSGTYTAHVVGVAPAADVALIQIEGVSGLPTVTVTSSSTLRVGDPVVAMGNALGLGGKPNVTTGTVTALHQSITASEGNGQSETLTEMIQSDAPISPGDSGGPIVNSAGQVVGMITAGDVRGFRSQTSTVNYAIPSDVALSYVNKAHSCPSAQTSSEIICGQVGYMGVHVQDASTGALVVSVVPGSPADSAGIMADSVITSVGGTRVSSSAALGVAIKSHRPGERVAVTWVDQRGSHTTTLTLGGVNP